MNAGMTGGVLHFILLEIRNFLDSLMGQNNSELTVVLIIEKVVWYYCSIIVRLTGALQQAWRGGDTSFYFT